MPVTISFATTLGHHVHDLRLGGRTLWVLAMLACGGTSSATEYPFIYNLVAAAPGNQALCDKYAPGTKFDHPGSSTDCYVSLGQDQWVSLLPGPSYVFVVQGYGQPVSVPQNPPPLVVPPGTYHSELYACRGTTPSRCSTRGTLVGRSGTRTFSTTTDILRSSGDGLNAFWTGVSPSDTATVCGVIRDANGQTWGDSTTYGGAMCDDSGFGTTGTCTLQGANLLTIDMGRVTDGSIPRTLAGIDLTRYTRSVSVKCTGDAELSANITVSYSNTAGVEQFEGHDLLSNWNDFYSTYQAIIGINGVPVYRSEAGVKVNFRPGVNELSIGAALVNIGRPDGTTAGPFAAGPAVLKVSLD